MLTGQYDISRDSWNSHESTLTPSTDFSTFTQRRKFYVTDPGVTINLGVAPVYAQPLYVPGLAIGNGTNDVVFVATLQGTVYAYDANDFTTSGSLTQHGGTINYQGKIYWARDDAYSVGSTALYHNCDVNGVGGQPVTLPVATLPFAGVVSTPVIDISAIKCT